MTTQPEALRLADSQDCVTDDNCGYCMPCSVATELRRLSAVEAELLAMRRVFSEAGCTFDVNYIRRLVRAEAQRDALLEALKLMLEQFTKTPSTLKDSEARIKAHAAIAQTEGQ